MEAILISLAVGFVGGVLSAHFVHVQIAKGKAEAKSVAQAAAADAARAAKKF